MALMLQLFGGDYETRHTAVTDVTAATSFVVTFAELQVIKK